MYIAKINYINASKGYGYLRSDEFDMDFAFYADDTNLNLKTFKVGDIVSFKPAVSKTKGLQYARDINPLIYFDKAQIRECYDYASGLVGQHVNETDKRNDQERFRDDLRGKLGETALRIYIRDHMPDAIVSDDAGSDIEHSCLDINGKHVRVMSVKQHSSYLIIEQDSFDDSGTSTVINDDGSAVKVDVYVLMRVNIDSLDGCEPQRGYDGINITSPMDILLQDEAGRAPETVCAELLGATTSRDFWEGKHAAAKGLFCTGKNLSAVCREEGVYDVPEDGHRVFLNKDTFIQSVRDLHSVKDVL